MTSSGPIERRLPTRAELSAAQKMRGFLKPGQMSGYKAHYRFPETGATDIGLSTISRGKDLRIRLFRERTMGALLDKRMLMQQKKLMSMFPQGTTLKIFKL